MSRYRVCFGCVTDEKIRYQRQAIFLLASLRHFGGEYADADFLLCVAGQLAPELLVQAKQLDARVIPVERVSGHLPATSKLRFLQRPELLAYDYTVLLDCDTAIVRPPGGLFGGRGVRARLAGSTSVPPAILADLFARAGLPPQDACYWTTVKPERTPLYANSGVIAVATGVIETFVDRWIKHQCWLLEQPELLPGCARHTNQASLSVALVDTGVPFEPLDIGFNFPVHRAPPSFFTPEISALAPTILHYDLSDQDGCLLPSAGRGSNEAIARLNDAWRRTLPNGGTPSGIASGP